MPAPRAFSLRRNPATPSALPSIKCKETGEEKTIVFGLTGTGYFDLVAYQKFNDHEMTDIIPTDEQLAASIAKLPKVAE